MIDFKNLTLGYGERILVKDVSLTIPQGQLTAMLGRNGSGKSTLIRAICGLVTPVSGRILMELCGGELAQTVSFVGTERIRIPNLKCRELVSMGRAPYTGALGRLRAKDRKAVMEALEAVGMTDYAERTLDRMSDGECQRIMIARALAQDTPVMVLDEPTAYLDLPGRYSIVALLKELAHSAGKTIIYSTHELETALEFADNVLLFDPPGLMFGPARDIADSGALVRIFGPAAETACSRKLESL